MLNIFEELLPKVTMRCCSDGIRVPIDYRREADTKPLRPGQWSEHNGWVQVVRFRGCGAQSLYSCYTYSNVTLIRCLVEEQHNYFSKQNMDVQGQNNSSMDDNGEIKSKYQFNCPKIFYSQVLHPNVMKCITWRLGCNPETSLVISLYFDPRLKVLFLKVPSFQFKLMFIFIFMLIDANSN